MNNNLYDSFLLLIRLGIGHHGGAISCDINWNAIDALAERQGLLAVVLDGIDKLNTNQPNCTKTLPLELKLEWIGEVLQNYEQRYVEYKKAIGSLAGFYNRHGFKMMVLKGYACSLDWPNPEHRPCGDIDIWLFGRQKEADALLSQEKGVEIDNSHHHHTVFEWQGFMVENHYDFVNVYHSKSNAKIEKVFKYLGRDESYYVEVLDEKVYLPSPNLHALFLLRHTMIEFAASSITIRQVLDWAFFVKKHGEKMDWEWLVSRIKEYHMLKFFNCINAICVDELGFESTLFPYIQFNPYLKDRVLKEILNPEIPHEIPKQFLKRVIWKSRRWKANQWKHELCYKESMWSAFWSGVWGHLLKPSSI